MTPCILSIDPGVSGMGVALWPAKAWGTTSCYPLEVANLYPKTKVCTLETLPDRVMELTWSLSGFLRDVLVEIVVIEYPEFHGSAGGHMVASKGDLVKLVFAVGGLSYYLSCEDPPATIKLIPASEWIGSLQKRVMQQRVRDRLPGIDEKLKPTAHSWDALGIGLHAQGRWIQERR